MSEPERTDKAPEEKPPTVYATPIMRVWAWIGVVYMIIIVLLFTWFMAKAEFIHGIGTLMVVPALVGLAQTALIQYRAGPKDKQRWLLCLLTVCVCAALGLWCLLAGIPLLTAQLGG